MEERDGCKEGTGAKTRNSATISSYLTQSVICAFNIEFEK